MVEEVNMMKVHHKYEDITNETNYSVQLIYANRKWNNKQVFCM